MFYGRCVPWAATVIAGVIFGSSGLLNVILFAATRPTLLPQREREHLTPRSLRFGTHIQSNSVISIPPVTAISTTPPGLSPLSYHARTTSMIPDELDNRSIQLYTPKISLSTFLDEPSKSQSLGKSPSPRYVNSAFSSDLLALIAGPSNTTVFLILRYEVFGLCSAVVYIYFVINA